MKNSQLLDGGLIVVAGHAIWCRGKFFGGFPGEDPFYEAHIAAGIQLLREWNYEHVVFSGTKSRPKLESETNGATEAEGMRNYAIHADLISSGDGRIILENFARDTFENLFFSTLAFHSKTNRWPSRVGVVSWNSKGLRVHLIAAGMRLGGKIFFHGVGDYPTQSDLERACAAEARFNSALVDVSFVPPGYVLVDPLLRNEAEFATKRWGRMPCRFKADAAGNKDFIDEVKKAYGANDPQVCRLIDQVETLKPGDGWRHIEWPWATGAATNLNA